MSFPCWQYQESLTSVGAVEVDGGSKLQKGDVVVELSADVVFLVNVDLGDSEVLLCAIEFQQLMLADANGVGSEQ